LLEATVQTLMERGYSGLSMSEVAARAGASKGALAHHFPTKADLVLTATFACFDEALSRTEKLLRDQSVLKDPIRAFIEDSIGLYFDWPFIAALEVLVVARTDAELMAQIEPAISNYRSRSNALWVDALERSGVAPRDAREQVSLTTNLIRGLAVYRLWHRDQRETSELLRSWERLLKR